MQELVQQLENSDGLDAQEIESTAEDTAEKASKMMEISSVAKELKSKKFGTTVRAILKEEEGHLDLCTKLAKNNAAAN